MSKSKCPECGYRAATAEKWLSAANPFSTDGNHYLIGCPQCNEAIKPLSVCDEYGCWKDAASTTPSDSGMLARCIDHDIVLPDQPRAATYRTDIRGWIDIHGRYHGNTKSAEESARFASATHSRCKQCSKIISARHHVTTCRDCQEVKKIEVYEAATTAPIFGTSFAVYSEVDDQYYFDQDDELLDKKWTRALLVEKRMYLCSAVDWPLIDTAEDFFGDALPEDVEPPQVLVDAAAAFDDIVRKVPTMAWYPSKVAWNGEFQVGGDS